MPYSLLAPKHRLIDHVNDVVKLGLLLARGARELWNLKIDDNKLIQVLLLHDVDKPLLYSRKGNTIQKLDLSYGVPHGVLGGLILNKVGFPDDIVYIVSTHSIESPFHGTESEAYILHYADLFSADHILVEAGAQPFYEKRLITIEWCKLEERWGCKNGAA